MIVGPLVLDVGAGGRSRLCRILKKVISLDVRAISGVDIVASAWALPFRNNAFDVVVCVDTLEHIPREFRKRVLQELKRVTKRRVVVHGPLEDGLIYRGRVYDIAFQRWYLAVYGFEEKNTEEHIRYVEPSPKEFETEGFVVIGTHNADLWLKYMRLQYMPFKLHFVKMMLSWIYYLINKKKDEKPPFWGGTAVCDKI